MSGPDPRELSGGQDIVTAYASAFGALTPDSIDDLLDLLVLLHCVLEKLERLCRTIRVGNNASFRSGVCISTGDPDGVGGA